MTVEAFLKNIGINIDECTNENNPILKYKLNFEYSEEQGNNTQYVIEPVKKMNINQTTKTITFE